MVPKCAAQVRFCRVRISRQFPARVQPANMSHARVSSSRSLVWVACSLAIFLQLDHTHLPLAQPRKPTRRATRQTGCGLLALHLHRMLQAGLETMSSASAAVHNYRLVSRSFQAIWVSELAVQACRLLTPIATSKLRWGPETLKPPSSPSRHTERHGTGQGAATSLQAFQGKMGCKRQSICTVHIRILLQQSAEERHMVCPLQQLRLAVRHGRTLPMVAFPG